MHRTMIIFYILLTQSSCKKSRHLETEKKSDNWNGKRTFAKKGDSKGPTIEFACISQIFSHTSWKSFFWTFSFIQVLKHEFVVPENVRISLKKSIKKSQIFRLKKFLDSRWSLASWNIFKLHCVFLIFETDHFSKVECSSTFQIIFVLL